MTPQESDELAKILEQIKQELSIAPDEIDEIDIEIAPDESFEIGEFIESDAHVDFEPEFEQDTFDEDDLEADD